MAKVVKLKDRQSNPILPLTRSTLVEMNSGESAQEKIDSLEDSILDVEYNLANTSLVIDESSGGGGSVDISSLLAKENLVSITFKSSGNTFILNAQNNFYIANNGDVLGRLCTTTFMFNDMSVTWDYPVDQNNDESGMHLGLYIKDDNQKYPILTINNTIFYASRDRSNAIVRFYINNDIVGTYQYLD